MNFVRWSVLACSSRCRTYEAAQSLGDSLAIMWMQSRSDRLRMRSVVPGNEIRSQADTMHLPPLRNCWYWACGSCSQGQLTVYPKSY
jgi:hypothetical protein